MTWTRHYSAIAAAAAVTALAGGVTAIGWAATAQTVFAVACLLLAYWLLQRLVRRTAPADLLLPGYIAAQAALAGIYLTSDGSAEELAIAAAYALAVAFAVVGVVRNGERPTRRAIDANLDLLALLPEDSRSRPLLTQHIDGQVEAYARRGLVRSR